MENQKSTNETTIQKVENHSEGLKVLKMYDAEAGDYVDVSPEVQKKACYVHDMIHTGFYGTALLIKVMFDEKLYLGKGCSSKQEYADNMLPFSKRQAERYYRVANRIQQFLPENATPVSHLESEELKKFDGLGIRKLYELTKLEDAEFEELAEGGEVGGKSLEDFKRMTAKQATSEIAKIRKVSADRISVLEEKNEMLKSENETLKIKDKDSKERMKSAQDLEYIYGKKRRTTEENRKAMADVNDLLYKAHELIVSLRVDCDSPQLEKQDLLSIRNKLDMMRDLFDGNYYEVVQEMSELA